MKPNSKLTWQVTYAPGTLSAKGYDAAGNVIAETKVETTGSAASIQLTPNRPTILADGEDVSVFTVSATDAQGRTVPVSDNQIQFAVTGPGKIIGVGNGDPSSHEPDVYVDQPNFKYIAADQWRYHLIPGGPDHPPVNAEYAPEFDDSSWSEIQAKTDDQNSAMLLNPHESAVYRTHVTLTKADLDSPVVQLHFPRIDDNGWVFVNGQAVGESHDWKSQPMFSAKQALHEGDNVVAVRVKNDEGQGGLNPGVNVEIALNKIALPWSRHLFNGLAEVIVQSTREAGEIKLTATSPDLQSATMTVETTPAAPRPEQP
jgi:beta-galactosidase